MFKVNLVIFVLSAISFLSAKTMNIKYSGEKILGELTMQSLAPDTISINGNSVISFVLAQSMLAVCGAGSYSGLYIFGNSASGGFISKTDTSWLSNNVFPRIRLSLDTLPGNGYQVTVPSKIEEKVIQGYAIFNTHPSNTCSIGWQDYILDGYNRILFLKHGDAYIKFQMYPFSAHPLQQVEQVLPMCESGNGGRDPADEGRAGGYACACSAALTREGVNSSRRREEWSSMTVKT